MAHRHNRRKDTYDGGWQLDNLFKLLFEIFIFAPFRLAKHNVIPNDEMPVGNVALDYLSCCVMLSVFGLAKCWIAFIILVMIVAIPIAVRIVLSRPKKEPPQPQQPENPQINHFSNQPLKPQPPEDIKEVESIIPDQKIKFNRQETVTPEMRDAPKVEFLAPDYNDMSDDQVNTLMKEQGIKLGHTKQQRLVAKKQPKQVSEPLPDFAQMDEETLKSWISNNASRITIKSTK